MSQPLPVFLLLLLLLDLQLLQLLLLHPSTCMYIHCHLMPHLYMQQKQQHADHHCALGGRVLSTHILATQWTRVSGLCADKWVGKQ